MFAGEIMEQQAIYTQAFTIPEAASQIGLSRSKIYLLIKGGELRARKAGRRTLVLASDLQRWLDSLPTA